MSEWTFQHPSNFKMLGKIGEGSFGTVVKVVDEKGDEYALKRIKAYASMPGNIQAPYARKICREVETLSMLQGCAYIVPLNKIYLSEDKLDVYMMMPYIQYDLQNVVESRVLKDDEIKWISYQMLYGIAQVHARKLMHRDLTLKNILISESFDTYIADFGLARAHQTCTEDITLDVVTLEYRAPELLLQHKRYDTRVDMWSIGCMIAELFLRRRLFVPVRKDIPSQLIKLIQVLGKPDLEFVRQHASPSACRFFEGILAKFDAAEAQHKAAAAAAAAAEGGAGSPPGSPLGASISAYDPPISVQLAAAGATPEAIALVESLLQFDFRKRLTAAEALRTPWFTGDEGYAEMEGVGTPLQFELTKHDHQNTTQEVKASSEGGNNNAMMTTRQDTTTTIGEGSVSGEPATPLDDGAVVRHEDEEGLIEETNPSLRFLQQANIEELRAFMEGKSEKITNLVMAEYASAPSVAEVLQ